MPGSGDTRYRDPNWLVEKYWEQKLTLAEIGDLCGVKSQTVLYQMRKHGIATRPKSVATKMAHDAGRLDTEERIEKISQTVKQHWANGVYDRTRRRHSRIIRQHWHDGTYGSPEHIERLRESNLSAFDPSTKSGCKRRRQRSLEMKKRWENGVYDGRHPSGTPQPYGGYILRSTWEKRLALVFDKLEWKWDYEPCRFSYVLDGMDHQYTPDFYVENIDTYFDPHGWFDDGDSKKFRAVRSQNDIALVVLDENMLCAYEAIVA